MIPMLPMQPINFVTVQQMYNLSKTEDFPLLSDFSDEFWAPYVNDYEHYDRVFNRLYKNYYYFMQDANLQAYEVQPDFTESVYDLLLMNRKKYSELYRVHTLDSETYNVAGNYDITETKEGENAKSITDTYGRQLTDVYGQRLSTGQNVTGTQSNNSTEKVAPYNSENFANENRSEVSLGQRTDTSSNTVNTATDTHTNSGVDSHEHEGTDSYELHRIGNDGRYKPTELIQSHIKLWNGFSFYRIIFADICKELLLIDKGYL